MKWPEIPLDKPITIEKLFTFYYKEAGNKFVAPPEEHDFWELVYVDKGSFDVILGNGVHHLNQGDIIFYKPREYHRGKAAKDTCPNLFILSFECRSSPMVYFENKSLPLNQGEKNIMGRLLKEAPGAFSRGEVPFGSRQLLANYLEILLVLLIRRGKGERVPTGFDGEKEDIFSHLKAYLQDNVHERLYVEDICRAFGISRSRIMDLFNSRWGGGVIQYFNHIKMERAKEIIRKTDDTFTQIAHDLSFSSINYFSRLFKQHTGMTPSEYARSVKDR